MDFFVVGFGGIAGLFLGASIMSGMEFLYYVLIGIGFVIHKINTMVRTKAQIRGETVKTQKFDSEKMKDNLKRI